MLPENVRAADIFAAGFKDTQKMKAMKTTVKFMAMLLCCAAVWSCTGVEAELPVPNRGGLSFGLVCAGYDDGPGTRTGFSPADYDMVEFAVMDSDGARVRDMKGYYDKNTSSILVEGLREGDYILSVMGVKGDFISDGLTVNDIDDIREVWVSFPDDSSAPLEAEYFHSSTPFAVMLRDTPAGLEYVTDLTGPIRQKRIVGRVDMTFSFRNAGTASAVLSNVVTMESPSFSTAMAADGTFSGRTTASSLIMDMTERASGFFLPSETETEGSAEIITRDYRGNTVRRSYGFRLPPVKANRLHNVGVDAIHPDDESGTLFVTEKAYVEGEHGKILQDDEPYTVYTDKAARNFNTASPLQATVLPDGRLNVRFYSPRDLEGVLLKARIPSEGDFFMDLAYFDRIPAFADFYGAMPLTEKDAFYRTDTGRIVKVEKKDPASLHDMEIMVESSDPYWSKLEKIEHGWNIRFDLFGGDPTLPDGGPQGNWMGIRPVHCREAVAFFLNFTYMIDMPEHERILRENQDRLYGNGGVEDKVSVETVLAQMRQPRTINVGLVYPGNGVVGLGGGSTFGAYQSGWLSHYDSLYSCEIMFHELGHVMGYSHSSSFTYGPWAQELMNHFYVSHLSEMPVDSPDYLGSKDNPYLYK